VSIAEPDGVVVFATAWPRRPAAPFRSPISSINHRTI